MTDETSLCAACSKGLHGRYCHGCGQDSQAKSAPLRQMALEAATTFSSVDSKLARTLAVLAVRPGRLLDAYRSGAGSLYVTPLKLFVAATALFLSVLNFTDTTLYQYVWKVDRPAAPVTAVYDPETGRVTVEGAANQNRWLQAKIEPAIDSEIVTGLTRAAEVASSEVERAALRYELVSHADEARMTKRLSDWFAAVLWLLMPLYALVLALFFGRRRLIVEHVIFALWAHAVLLLFAIGLAALNSRGLNLSAALLAFPYLAYFTVAAANYYGMPWWQAMWRGTAHMLIYIFAILLPVAVVVYATVLDWDAYLAYAASV